MVPAALAGLALIAAASAADGAPSADAAARRQQVHVLEWHRGPAAAIAKAGEGADPSVRKDVAVALGRLQSADALPYLVAMENDADDDVRMRVAEALGYTPGSAPELRAWLDREPSVAKWAAPAHGDDLRARLIESLGRAGDGTDVPRLTTALAEAWPVGAAAADALARMGRREVAGADAAVPALIAMTSRPDPRTVEASAYALRRVLTPKSPKPTPEQISALETAARTAPTAPAKAWFLRAVWPFLDGDGKQALFAESIADPAAVVRVSALDAVQEGDVPLEALAPLLDDRDAWVRDAAIAAVGRDGGGENAQKLLEAHEKGKGDYVAAEVVEALAAAGVAPAASDATDPSKPAPVRAAAAAALTDVPTLVSLLKDPVPAVRSSAAQALLDAHGEVPTAELVAMLGSEDLVVRETAVELLGRREASVSATGPAPAWVAPLVAQLRVDTDPDVLAPGFELLATHVVKRPKDVDPKDKLVADTVLRGLTHPDPAVRKPAARLASELKLSFGDVVPREDVALPNLADVHGLLGATVVTDRGEFHVDFEPDVAPLAVANFAQLADSHFFDGQTWHRVVPAFVVQTGDPRGDGSGGPGWTLPDEVSALPYKAGAVGMARSGPDTGGSQWFVTLTPQPHLEGDYTLFGYVTSGLDVVRQLQRGDHVVTVRIERAPLTASSAP